MSQVLVEQCLQEVYGIPIGTKFVAFIKRTRFFKLTKEYFLTTCSVQRPRGEQNDDEKQEVQDVQVHNQEK